MAKIFEKFIEHDGTLEAGAGVGQISVNVDDSTIEKGSGTGIKVKAAGITGTELATSVAGAGLIGGGGSALAVGVGTYITVNADDVAVNIDALGTQLAGSGISYNTSTDTINVGAGTYITVAADTVDVNIDALGAQLAGGGLAYNNTTDTINIGAGTHITVNTDDIAVNTTTLIPVIGAAIDGAGLNWDGAELDVAVGNGIEIVSDAVALGALTSNWDVSGDTGRIIVPTPTADGHVANKGYVDSVASGLDVKASCDYITVSNFTITTTVVATVQNALDPISSSAPTLVVGDRILVKDQSTQSQNGIYEVVSTSGGTVLQRASDANDNTKVTPGMFTFIEKGDAYADSGWVLTTDAPITLDTTSLVFAQFSGAGQINAGSGLTKAGNTLNVGDGTYTIIGSDNVDVDIDALGTQLAGSGLSYNTSTDTLNINAGTGLAFTGDDLDVVGGNGIDALANNIQLGDLTADWQTYDGVTRRNIKGIANPVDPQDAATKDYVDTAVSSSSSYVVGTIELTSTHASNEYINFGDVAWSTSMPDADSSSVEQAILIVKHGPGQFYGDDFALVESGGVGTGYDRLSWASLGLDGILAAGDKLTLQYKI